MTAPTPIVGPTAAAPAPPAGRLAWLVNQYPKVSHTFIRREIEALEDLGAEIDRIAVRTGRHGLTDAEDLAEADRTHGVLAQGARRLLADAFAEARRAPRRLLSTLRLALRLGARSERGRPVHLVYLLEACHLARRCRARGVRHLHAHFGTNSATVALLAAELAGIPWSFTVHGPEEFDAPRALSLGEKAARAAFTVAISRHGRSQLMRWTPPEAWGRLEVVRCGLDLARFDAAAAADGPDPGPPEAPELVCVGRLSEQKGQLLLLDALAEARARVPDLRLTLVGDGEMRGAVEARIAALGLEGAVEITGWADGAEVRRRVRAARALVLASFAEGLPVVIMEALALGRPVVSTWVAGIPELVDADCGWRVPAGDAEALAAAMAEAATAPTGRLAGMGRAGRARVEAMHDLRAEARRLLSLIEAAANPSEARA